MIFDNKLIEVIKAGGVGVIPTDTIYGIVASVLKPEALQRVYIVKGRPKYKQMVHLISNINQLQGLGIYINTEQQQTLSEVWPAPLSIIFKTDDTLPSSHAGTFTVAVRMPDSAELRQLVEKTGPIVATSANVSGQPSSNNIEEIRNQLPNLDFYIEEEVGTIPSKLARINVEGELEYLKRS